jgi:hypothetical protein
MKWLGLGVRIAVVASAHDDDVEQVQATIEALSF